MFGTQNFISLDGHDYDSHLCCSRYLLSKRLPLMYNTLRGFLVYMCYGQLPKARGQRRCGQPPVIKTLPPRIYLSHHFQPPISLYRFVYFMSLLHSYRVPQLEFWLCPFTSYITLGKTLDLSKFLLFFFFIFKIQIKILPSSQDRVVLSLHVKQRQKSSNFIQLHEAYA